MSGARMMRAQRKAHPAPVRQPCPGCAKAGHAHHPTCTHTAKKKKVDVR